MARIYWPLVTACAVFAYLYGIGNPEIPNIGDEAPYIQIARMTAESGHWLPLGGSERLLNTKPPLLFWQGVVSSSGGRAWDLVHLRLPIVFYTFLAAVLVFLLARRIGRGNEPGYLAALTFLCFHSTFQYGRPFVTNMPETFFAFVPFFMLLYAGEPDRRLSVMFWLLAGLSLGAACLYRSFALVVPVTLGLAVIRLQANRWAVASTLGRDGGGLFLTLLVGLACFALWPLLDPNPGAVFSRFVVGENVSKLSRGNYFTGLFTGGYTVFRIWLGNFANAGFMALPLALLAWDSIRNRYTLSAREKALWTAVVCFMAVYTIPAQRQENYLLPTLPALAVLLGLRWNALPRQAFYVFALPTLVVAAAFLLIHRSIDSTIPGAFAPWQHAVVLATLLFASIVISVNRIAALSFHLLVILLLISASSILAVFDGPRGRYSERTIAEVTGKTVYVPSHFVANYEWYQFQLHGANIESYDENDFARRQQLLESGALVAVKTPLTGRDLAANNYDSIGTRLVMRQRQTAGEMLDIAFGGRVDLLMEREAMVRRRILSR